MCLTIPGRILTIDSSDPAFRIARVDFGVAVKDVNLVYTPGAEVGSYVIVHAGFATDVLPAAEAEEALGYVRQLSEGIADPGPSSEGVRTPPETSG